MRSGLNATLLEYVRSFAPETTMQDDTKRNNKKAPSKRRRFFYRSIYNRLYKFIITEWGVTPISVKEFLVEREIRVVSYCRFNRLFSI